ncbi:MAG: hypothetical protein NC191_05875 [Muribaculaceae bacterium]|nr:hypothetical protein [Muribaculaceae bacterium]
MGLAASQARFLCITARKADCEYRSTDLAQQKLNITNQLSAVSNEYANSMNATKLMWSNETVDGDYGLSYSVLMTPSAVNDFNPYMITTPSGSVILNGEYAAAARAAGISKAGGVGSQVQRDKFIQAMVPNGLVTQETANAITKYDFNAVKDSSGAVSFTNLEDAINNEASDQNFSWNPFAGVGGTPLNKSVVDAMQLQDLANSVTFGQKALDWSVLVLKEGEISKVAYNERIAEYAKLASLVQKNEGWDTVISTLEKHKNKYEVDNAKKSSEADYIAQIKQYDELIAAAKNLRDDPISDSSTYFSNTNFKTLKSGIDNLKYKFQKDNPNGGVEVDSTKFNVDNSSKIDAAGKYSVVVNGVLSKSSSNVNGLTMGDLLTNSIVLVSNLNDKNKKDPKLNQGEEDVEAFRQQIVKLVNLIYDSLASFSTDEASRNALEFAKTMTARQFSRIIDTGSNTSTALTDNTAYKDAINNNAIGADKSHQYLAVSLSNMISSFLTYYDNSLNGADSNYVVGKSAEQSVYVTDNLNYYYVFQDDTEAVTNVREKSADFYDELYNNILAHGWREDSSIDDSEYLESMIKDGRYSMSSLNQDGHYYQTRYNDTGYIVEVTDTDAIARAEAEFTAKKAELTYKEDSIDLKSKKLDLEISALSQEYQSVQTMINNGIQKVFQMFQ